MCGISGWILEAAEDATARRERLVAYISASLAALVARGPDSAGVAEFSRGAIAARRLAILDLEGGDQPLYNEDRSVAAVLNGEIYNFEELRSRLESCGHRFRSRTDTEVLVHGWEEWGTRLPEYLDGMFAFAVWDDRQGTLFAARDRLGKKPFFFTQDAGGFRFASEIKALLSDGAIRPRPSLPAIAALLTLQHLPPPMTPLEGIRQLEPGMSLVFEGGKLRMARYWDIVELAEVAADSTRPPKAPSPAEALEKIQEAAVRRTRADVPVGVFLSGGIDSSLVAAALHRAGHDLETFSVAFDDPRFDESPRARTVARHLGCRHTVLVVDQPKPDEIVDVVWHLDEPLADSSAIPQMQICKAASSRLKVVISGDGGDEFFGGYLKHRQFVALQRVLGPVGSVPGTSRVARAVSDLAAGLAGRLEARVLTTRAALGSQGIAAGSGLTSAAATSVRRASRALALAASPFPDSYFDYLSPVPSFERSTVLGEGLLAELARVLSGDPDSPVSAISGLGDRLARVGRLAGRRGPLFALAVVDALTELPGDILVKVDRMSMANSLEVRSPLLDRSLVEWSLSLPELARLRRGETKPLLRDAARMLLPPEVAAAPKRGFGVPLSEWMRGELGVLAAEILLDEKTRDRGWISPGHVRDLISRNLAGHDMGARIWQLLVLELWARSFIDSSPPSPPSL